MIVHSTVLDAKTTPASLNEMLDFFTRDSSLLSPFTNRLRIARKLWRRATQLDDHRIWAVVVQISWLSSEPRKIYLEGQPLIAAGRHGLQDCSRIGGSAATFGIQASVHRVDIFEGDCILMRRLMRFLPKRSGVCNPKEEAS